MIALVFATKEEAAPFLSRYARGRFEGLSEGDSAHDDTLLVALTGTGKIKATLRTERMLQQHTVKRLFHVGTCTALSKDLEVGTIVSASQVFEGDRIELAAPTYPRMPLGVPFDELTDGTLVTQDHVIKGESEQSYWQRIADVSDMTGYAIAYVAATHGVPCHIVKVVTGHFSADNKEFRKRFTESNEAMASFMLDHLETLLTRDE